MMLHEVLLALLGHSGSIIQETERTKETKGLSKTTFLVPDSISFLTATERAAINRVVGLGSTYRDLRRLVRPHPLNEAVGVTLPSEEDVADSNGEGLYVRALKLGVEELLDEYGGRIAEVEMDVMADPTMTLARVHAGVREVRAVDVIALLPNKYIIQFWQLYVKCYCVAVADCLCNATFFNMFVVY